MTGEPRASETVSTLGTERGEPDFVTCAGCGRPTRRFFGASEAVFCSPCSNTLDTYAST